MKFSIVTTVLLGAAGQAAAQASCLSGAINSVPTCAHQCLLSANNAIGCQLFDVSCPCKSENSVKISTLAETCVVSECGSKSVPAVVSGVSEFCKCAVDAGSGSSTPASASAKPTA